MRFGFINLLVLRLFVLLIVSVGISRARLVTFDLVAGAVLSNVSALGSAANCLYTPDGTEYVSLLGLSEVYRADTVTKEVIGFTRVSEYSILTANSSGSAVSSLSQVFSAPDSEVVVIDTATNTVTYTAPMPLLSDPAVDAGARFAYAAIGIQYVQAPEIARIDLKSGAVQTLAIPNAGTGGTGVSVALAPDDSRLYALFDFYGITIDQLCAIDTASFQLLECAAVPAGGVLPDNLPELAVSGDGSKLFTNVAGLSEFDAGTLQYLRTFSTAQFITLYYSAAANSVYLIEESASTSIVERIDLNTFSMAASQTLSYQATGLAITPDGSDVYVAGSSTGIEIFQGQTLAPDGSIATALASSVAIVP